MMRLVLLLLLILGFGGFFLFLRSESGNQWISSKLTNFLEKATGDTISIGKLEIQFPDIIHAENLVMKDGHNTEMFNIRRLDADFGYYNFITGKVTISDVSMDSLIFHLAIYKKDRLTNLGYVIDRLSAGPSSGSKFKMLVKSVTLKNVNFTYDDFNDTASVFPTMINWSHIAVNN